MTALQTLYTQEFQTLNTSLPQLAGRDLHQWFNQEFMHSACCGTPDEIIRDAITLLRYAFRVSIQLGAGSNLMTYITPVIDPLRTQVEAYDWLADCIEGAVSASRGSKAYSPVSLIDALFTLLATMGITVAMVAQGIQGEGV